MSDDTEVNTKPGVGNSEHVNCQIFDDVQLQKDGVPHGLKHLLLREVTEENVEIGRGAYGRVFKVLVRKQLCAAKEVHPALIPSIDDAQHSRIRTMFYRECDCHSRLDHPNVVKMIGLYPNQSPLPWLVMELMDTNLTKYLEDNACDEVLPETKSSIIMNVAEAVKYLHSMDIVHRDLSSNNILLMKNAAVKGDSEMAAKIADFGVAKVMSNHSKSTSQRGTEHFMPPEMFFEQAHCGKPVDVFSLACVILHIMSHQWPKPKHATEYVDDELIALTEDKRRADYLKCCSPPLLQELAALCLCNKPAERPKASELWHKLKEILLCPPMCDITPSNDHMQVRAAKSLSARMVIEKVGSLCKSRGHIFSENDFSESSEDNWDSSDENVSNEETSDEDQKEEPPQGKRYLIVKELSTTEQTFVEGLKLLKDFGQEILSTDKTRKKPLLPEKTLNKILFKVDELHAFHEDLSGRLAERVNNWNTCPTIGDVMIRLSHSIKHYFEAFAKNFQEASKLLDQSCKTNEALKEYIALFEARPQCNQIHFTISGHLLEIMQRVPSCKRLLDEYCNALPDSDERKDCEASLELIWEAEAIAKESIQGVNKFEKLLEVQKKLEGYRGDSLIAPDRVFLYEGELFGFNRQAVYLNKCMFFLFSDILLYTEPISNLNRATAMYKIIRRIPLNGIEVSDYTAVKHGIRIKNPSKTLFRLGAKSEEVKARWMKVVKDAVYEHEAVLQRQERYRTMTKSKEARISLGNEVIGSVPPPTINQNGVSNCRECGVRFTLTRRRYHCQACGCICCNSCTSQSFHLQYLNKQGRVCQECYKNLRGMHSALGKLVASTAGQESHVSEVPKTNKLQKNQSSSMDIKPITHLPGCEVYGYLQVKKNRWRKEWLEIAGLVLFVYENKEVDFHKRQIVLTGYHVIHPIPDKQDESQWCITHPDPKVKIREVHFKADNVEIARKWVKVLKAAVLGVTQQPK